MKIDNQAFSNFLAPSQLMEVKQPHYIDFETLNTNRFCYNEPHQMALRRMHGNQMQTRSVRFRISSMGLPHPGALLVSGVTFNQISDPTLPSQWERSEQIKSYLDATPNSIRIAYNSPFDEGVMRQLFFYTANNPYVGDYGGRGSFCAWRLMLVSGLLASSGHGLAIPKKDGFFDSSLVSIAENAGLQINGAHDAGVDVTLTEAIVEMAYARCPQLRLSAILSQDKNKLRQMARSAPFFITVSYGKKRGPFVVPQVLIGQSPIISNQDLAIKLDKMPDTVGSAENLNLDQQNLSENEIVEMLTKFKANAGTTHIFPGKVMDLLVSKRDQESFAKIGKQIKENESFCRLCREITLTKHRSFSKSNFHEENMFCGFYSKSDEAVIKRFHVADPKEKYGIIDDMADARLKHFALLTVYENWPSCLPPKILDRCDEYVAFRVTSNESPSFTVGEALSEIEALYSNKNEADRKILQSYASELNAILNNPVRRLRDL